MSDFVRLVHIGRDETTTYTTHQMLQRYLCFCMTHKRLLCHIAFTRCAFRCLHLASGSSSLLAPRVSCSGNYRLSRRPTQEPVCRQRAFSIPECDIYQRQCEIPATAGTSLHQDLGVLDICLFKLCKCLQKGAVRVERLTRQPGCIVLDRNSQRNMWSGASCNEGARIAACCV